jgi:hypothetical protein
MLYQLSYELSPSPSYHKIMGVHVRIFGHGKEEISADFRDRSQPSAIRWKSADRNAQGKGDVPPPSYLRTRP